MGKIINLGFDAGLGGDHECQVIAKTIENVANLKRI